MSNANLQESTVKVWDPLVRIFHWSLVLFFFTAFIAEDDWLDLHVQAGYAVGLLLGFRIIWGLIGTRLARFHTFIKSPAVVFDYLKAMLTFNVPHYRGHNPVAAVMVLALLTSILMITFTGLVLIAGSGQGPLSGTFLAGWSGDWLEDVHEFFANFTLLLVLGHVSGVVISSLLEGENLARAMLTGRKKFREHWVDDKPAKEQVR